MNDTKLLLAALLLASPLAARAAPEGQAPEPESRSYEEFFDRVPPGTPDEVDLWRRGQQSILLLQTARLSSTRLQQRLKYQGTDVKLQALVKGSPGDQRLAALWERLAEANRAVVALVKEQWPVDPLRGCSNEFIDYESQLWSDKSPAKQARVDQVGKTLASCLQRLEAITGTAGRLNKAFAAAIVEAEQVVAAAGTSKVGEAAGTEVKK